MKKSLWLALVLILACVLTLSACNSGTDQPQNPDIEQSTNQPTDNNNESSSADNHTHTFGQWTTIKDATCTVKGEQEHFCSCGEKEAQSIDALGHTEVVDASVAATCTTDGKTEGKHCSRCNETLVAQTTVAALNHVEVIDSAVAATCTTDGKTEGKHCSRCNETLVAQTTVAALNHVEVIDSAVVATCTTDGKTEGKHCSRCNEILVAQTTVGALGHVEVVDSAVAATCTQTGLTEGKHCSVCNTVTVNQTTVKAKGHSYINDVCENCNTLIDQQGAIESENKRHNEYVKMCEENIALHEKEAERLKVLYGISQVSEDVGYYGGLLNEINTNIQNIKNNITWYEAEGKYYGIDYSSQILSCKNSLAKEEQRKKLCEQKKEIAFHQDEAKSYQPLLEEEDIRHAEKIKIINAKYYCLEYGHTNIVIDPAKITICGSEALSEGSHCADCNMVIIEQVVTPPPGHSFDKGNTCSVCGAPKPSAGLRYSLRSDGKSYALSGMGSCTDTNVLIADLYNGLPVVEISSNAFSSKKQITSVIVPENVRIIGEGAFWKCENLVLITLPSTLEEIKNMAFYDCKKLKGVYISDLSKWCSIDFIDQYDENPLNYAGNLYLNGVLVTDLVIPNNVTKISPCAFSDCTSITSVTIPATVKTIGQNAFSGCKNLKEVKVENGVTTIEKYGFYACRNLETIIIGKDVKAIGEWAFEYCDKLTTVYFAGSKTAWNAISVGSNNTKLSVALCYYYSSTKPNQENVYWHYVDGIPTVWQ